MTTQVDAVIFDLDRTLCRYRRPGSEVLSTAFNAVGIEPCFTIGDYGAIADEYVADSETGQENRRRCFAALADEAGHEPDVGHRIAEAYAAERDQSNVRWVEDAADALATIESQYATALITNGAPEWQRQKLDALGLANRFEVVVYAGYETAPKPDSEPFEVALEGLDVRAERAVNVGDSLSLDIKGAQAAGLRSVLFDPDRRSGQSTVAASDSVPDHRIASMAELSEEPWR